MLLLASCGQQHQAKSIIKDFIDRNISESSARGSISIVRFDSTKVLADSIILRMRTNADTTKRYQKPIKYDEGEACKKFFTVRIKYTINDTEYSETHYLDDQLSRVVAFKTN